MCGALSGKKYNENKPSPSHEEVFAKKWRVAKQLINLFYFDL